MRRRKSQNFNDVAHLFMLIISCKKRVPEMKFSDNTPKRPDINFPIVSHAENNLRRPVIPTLNVSVNGFVLKATWAKVDNSDSWLVGFFE